MPRSTRHVLHNPLETVHSLVNWGAYKDTVVHPSNIRYIYDPVLDAQSQEVRVAGKWFKVEATNYMKKSTEFIGVFDLTGLGLNCIIADRTFRATTNGAGTFLGLNEVGGGLRLTTGATSGNDNTLTDGDNNGTVYTWNVMNDINLHVHFRFPMIGDIDDTYFLGCLYEDGDNYIGVRYDPSGAYFPAHSNLFFVTRADGVETVTGLGAPLTGVWYYLWARHDLNEVYVCNKTSVVATHTTNIPDGNLSYYVFLETQENAAKRVDMAFISMLQRTLH